MAGNTFGSSFFGKIYVALQEPTFFSTKSKKKQQDKIFSYFCGEFKIE